ncbi:hypothetical protein, partial [Exiguobacterium sp. CinTr1]|uniref:hypothetical protein n=1 Tax=Exiguobacterium sp. CinTr1 TaxID=2995315 RepID=UPI0022E5C006
VRHRHLGAAQGRGALRQVRVLRQPVIPLVRYQTAKQGAVYQAVPQEGGGRAGERVAGDVRVPVQATTVHPPGEMRVDCAP